MLPTTAGLYNYTNAKAMFWTKSD